MIDSHTTLYCIFGKPVRHSLSPLIHNQAFRQYRLNSIYLAFEPENAEKAVLAMKSLDIKGASVTLPYKERVLPYLDWIDEDACAIGAVNTIVQNQGRLEGFNTDWQAAVEPLKPYGIQGKEVWVLGAGGAASAVAYGIDKEKGRLVILNRDQKKGDRLAQKFNGRFLPLDEIKKNKTRPDIIINTTPVGMQPDTDALSFPARFLFPGAIVMDIIYRPLTTLLLKEAGLRKCITIDGLAMFLHQGAAQFKLWTGISPDISFLRQTLSGQCV